MLPVELRCDGGAQCDADCAARRSAQSTTEEKERAAQQIMHRFNGALFTIYCEKGRYYSVAFMLLIGL